MNPDSSVFRMWILPNQASPTLTPASPQPLYFPPSLHPQALGSSAQEVAGCFCKENLHGAHLVLSCLCGMPPNTWGKTPQRGLTLILSLSLSEFPLPHTCATKCRRFIPGLFAFVSANLSKEDSLNPTALPAYPP